VCFRHFRFLTRNARPKQKKSIGGGGFFGPIFFIRWGNFLWQLGGFLFLFVHPNIHAKLVDAPHKKNATEGENVRKLKNQNRIEIRF
jgi:hypothetical protein